MTTQCPKCKAENPDTKQFCGECGTQLTPVKETPIPTHGPLSYSAPFRSQDAKYNNDLSPCQPEGTWPHRQSPGFSTQLITSAPILR
jgi:hypothetical protein